MIRRMLPAVAVGVLAAACFLPALSGSFLNWDDDINFGHNVGYRGFGREQIRWVFTSVLFGHYIPITRLTFNLNYFLGGLNPFGYHLLNVLLHGVNGVLFYLVARRLLSAAVGGGSDVGDAQGRIDLCAGAVVAALVFGVHPLRVEPVSWVTGRADLLCTTFVLLSTLAYLRAVDGPATARRDLILVSAAGFAAAFLSKASALPLPVALLLLDVYPLRRVRRLGWRSLVKEKVPLWVVAAGATVIAAYATRHGVATTGIADYDVASRLIIAAYSFVVPVARFVVPAGLLPIYEMPHRVTLLEPRFGLAVAAAVLITTGLVLLRRRCPGALAAWIFSAVMLAPVSLGVRKTADLAPDRYSYLAGLGFALLAGGAVVGGLRLIRRGVLARPMAWVIAGGCLAAITGLGFMSWTYAEMWTDAGPLWRWAIELDPSCGICYNKLGEVVFGDPARAQEAEHLFRRSIGLRPDHANPHFNLAMVLAAQGRYAEAEAPLRDYIERVPRSAFGPARLGYTYFVQSRFDAAIPQFRIAIARQPDMPELRGFLIQALEARARELQAAGLGAQAASLLAESRALGSAN